MTRFNCFSALVRRKNKDKENKPISHAEDYYKTLQVKIEGPAKPSETADLKSISFSVPLSFGILGDSRCEVKVISHESSTTPVKGEVAEVAYEGEDELEENLSMKRINSDFDFQAHDVDSNEEADQSLNRNTELKDAIYNEVNDQIGNKPDKEAVDLIQSGHASDPGAGNAEFWTSPKLKRSCSDLETREVLREITDQLPPSKSESFEQLQMLGERLREEVLPENIGSPRSVTTHFSADKVMLKKHSASLVLPSRSRRLWWKLYLWSHRNPHLWPTKPQAVPIKSAFNQQGGYCSDTLEPNRALELGKTESPELFNEEPISRASDNDNQSWRGFDGGVSGFWPQNQWVAFPAESPLTRVDEWVQELVTQPMFTAADDKDDSSIMFPPSPETGRSPERITSHLTQGSTVNLSVDILHANSVILSLNSSSMVAHIAGIGLKVIPTLSQFSSLRSVNLSGNLIVNVSPGSLPKGLHTLNLSRNKISAIEGFRELTRLRVLDLSYNRISRIGQGLSNCTLVKELYLSGNKISDIEGLHRLLKLTVLDLSFNRITTAKALGQLVANYNSLLALNLLGNPIHINMSDGQLRKAVSSLLPKLAYLNKQPINPQKAREVATESVAKAAQGNSSWNSRRKSVKRVSHSGSLATSGHRSSASIAQKSSSSSSRSKGRTHHHSDLKMKSTELASSSR